MNKNANSADVRRLTRAAQKAGKSSVKWGKYFEKVIRLLATHYFTNSTLTLASIALYANPK